MNTRPLPYNLNAEAGVLGTVLNNSHHVIDTVLEIIGYEDFYDSRHRLIFKAVEELNEKGSAIDVLTVCDSLGEELVNVGGITYLTELMDSSFSMANIKEHSLIVKDKSNRRKIINAGISMINQAYDDSETEDVISTAQDQLLKITSHESSDVHSIFDVSMTAIEEIDRNFRQGGGVVGQSTGISDLDKMLMGLKPADYVIVAARPSMGKTALMLTLAYNVARDEKKTVLVFSLEMTKENLITRMFATVTQIPLERIKGAKMKDEEWGKLTTRVNLLAQSNIFFDDKPFQSVGEMRNKCKQVKHDHGLDMIIIDYIGKIKPTGSSDSRNLEVSRISGALKDLGKEMKCPVVALSQLSRAPEARPDHRPMLSDLRESGSIEQDADVVMFLYRDEYYNKETQDKNILEAIIAKNRDGRTGTVRLFWDGSTQTIAGLDLTYEAQYSPRSFNKED